MKEETNLPSIANSSSRLSLPEIISSPAPAVSALRKTNEAEVLAMIRLLMSEVCQQFNVHQAMTPGQIEQGSLVLIDKFYWFKINDFVLCFKNGVMGEYGRIQYSMDIHTFVKWCDDYSTQRAQQAEKESMKRHTQAKHSQIVAPELVTVYKQIRESLKDEPQTIEPRKVDNSQRIIGKIHDQFLRKLNENSVYSVIEYKGKFLDWHGFAKMRLASVNRMIEGRSVKTKTV